MSVVANNVPTSGNKGIPYLSGSVEFKQAAGIPLNKNDLKALYGNCYSLKAGIKELLRNKDKEDAVNRYVAYNIPMNISSQEMERMLYQKGKMIFWYWEEMDQYMFTPYTLYDGLDAYGRYVWVQPVPIAEAVDSDEPKVKAQKKALAELMSLKKLKVVYDVQLEEDYLDKEGNFDLEKAKELINGSAVIFYDYTPNISYVPVPRIVMNESVLDVMSECIPFARTALKNSTGVKGMRVNNEDESSNVVMANALVDQAALKGDKYVPIIGNMEFQDLTGGDIVNANEFMQAMQELNNFRLSLYGLDNNGLYDKKAYVNNLQSGVSNIGLSLQDGLTQRQNSCAICNSIWDIHLWYEINETVSGQDINMDGVNYDTDTFINKDSEKGGNPDGNEE